MKNRIGLSVIMFFCLYPLFGNPAGNTEKPLYAQGFELERFPGYTAVTVKIPRQNKDLLYTYYLVERDKPVPREIRGKRIISVPLKSFVTMSTTYLSFVELLDVTDLLIGHDNLSYIYSPAIQERIKEGKLREIGSGNRVNVEALLDMDPGAVFTYPVGLPEWYAHPVLETGGLPVVLTAEALENDPLGRAEWILFFSLFFGQEEKGRTLFGEIERAYRESKNLLSDSGVGASPSVILNNPWQGTWFVPAGENYLPRLISDAGGNYLWASERGAASLPVSFETVLDRGESADFWLNVNWNSRSEALASEPRSVLFKAFTRGRIYNLKGRVNADGANDFFESGVARPDLILKDLIYLFHPEVLPKHEFYYIRRLE